MRVPVIVLGILLVVAGTAVLIYQGITITTMERQLLEVGPLSASTAEGYRTIPLPPIVGGIVLAAGAVLILAASIKARKSESNEPTGAPS